MPHSIYPKEFDPLAGSAVYEKLECLDTGKNGFVHLCRDKRNDEVVAIKFLRKTVVNEYVEQQIVNHSLLKHPHVCLFKECFVTNDFVAVVMEWATEGNLQQLVRDKGRLSEGEARSYFQQLMVGIDYIERKGLANRDIKLENTLLTVDDDDDKKYILKICDFGYSIHEQSERPKEEYLMYMAPECMEDAPYDDKIADIWSAGVILYLTLFGHFPYEIDTHGKERTSVPLKDEVKELHDYEKHHKVRFPEDVSVSEACMNLLTRMLEPEPSKRVTLKEVLADPWFVTDLPDYEAHLNDMVKEEKITEMAKRQSTADIKQLLDFALA